MDNYSGCFEESGKIPGSFAISWEQRKLKDVLVSLQNNTLSRADLSNEEGVAKNVHYGDVLIKFREILDVSKEKLPMISDESILSKYKASFLQNGDVIVADTAEDSTVGKCSEIAGLNDEVVLSGLHTIPYRPIEKFASGYLGYYLNSSAYHNQLIPLMQGIKVTSISKSAMQDTVIVCPKSVEEQGKIGDYLQSLDNLITLHQRKQCILYIMEKLLCGKSKQLEKSISWEQRKLGNMMDVTSVKRIHQSDWTDSGVRFLRARDIVAESKNEEVSEPIFISQEKYDEYSAVSGKVEKGDLLVTGVGTIGVPMLINSEEPLYFKDGNIIWFKNKNAIDGRFFYHSFKGLNIQKFIKESAGTGTVGTYTIENGKKTPINLPLQKEEQEKIGEYFSNLDNLIALHQRKP